MIKVFTILTVRLELLQVKPEASVETDFILNLQLNLYQVLNHYLELVFTIICINKNLGL